MEQKKKKARSENGDIYEAAYMQRWYKYPDINILFVVVCLLYIYTTENFLTATDSTAD